MPLRLARVALLAILLSCANPGPLTRPEPCCPEIALRIAERHRVDEIRARRFTHAELWSALDFARRHPALRTEEIGRSMQGRPIRAVTFGVGPTAVLLWSQMHGDEPTATMALADIISFFAGDTTDPLRERLRRALTVTMVPMLNPDGAERYQRENAAGIDINRDARRLATPEARALKALRDRITPEFGFNLHDQGARTLAGPGGRQVAIALLAPATDPDRGYDTTRARARLVASAIVEALEGELPGRIAKYDDTFNPRAFGDLMQRWGTSTVLIESGALPDDPEKQRLRALNVAAILSALDAIATARYRRADPALYERLPFNLRIASDVLLVGAKLVLEGTDPIDADLALTYDDPVARTGLRLREVGDLAGAVALDTVDLSGRFIHPDASMLDVSDTHRWLALDRPVELWVREGVSAESAVVRRFGGDEPAPDAR